MAANLNMIKVPMDHDCGFRIMDMMKRAVLNPTTSLNCFDGKFNPKESRLACVQIAKKIDGFCVPKPNSMVDCDDFLTYEERMLAKPSSNNWGEELEFSMFSKYLLEEHKTGLDFRLIEVTKGASATVKQTVCTIEENIRPSYVCFCVLGFSALGHYDIAGLAFNGNTQACFTFADASKAEQTIREALRIAIQISSSPLKTLPSSLSPVSWSNQVYSHQLRVYFALLFVLGYY
jgi:hypothetical protein